MILTAIFVAAVVLFAAGHTCRTVTRAAARDVESNATVARAITAATNQAAFDRMGRTR